MTRTTTVLVVTHNAPKRLAIIVENLLTVFHATNVYVADSSPTHQIPPGVLANNYFHYPNSGLLEKSVDALQRINSEYVLFHPDGELLNVYSVEAFRRYRDRGPFTSLLSLNLNVRRGELGKVAVSPRNYRAFRELLQRLPNERGFYSMTPYYQLIWSYHKRDVLLRFLKCTSGLDWNANQGAHVSLFERLYNICAVWDGGKLVVSDEVVFFRLESEPKFKSLSNLVHIDKWLSYYKEHKPEHLEFMGKVAWALSNTYQLPLEEVKSRLLFAFANDAISRKQLHSVSLRVKRRLASFLKVPCHSVDSQTDDAGGKFVIQCDRIDMNSQEFSIFVERVASRVSAHAARLTSLVSAEP